MLQNELFSLSQLPDLAEPGDLPWYAWLLFFVVLGVVIFLVLHKTPEEKQRELEEKARRLEQASIQLEEEGAKLMEKAQDLLEEGAETTSSEIIEHDLDGIEGPEVVERVFTRESEDEEMRVTQIVREITSLEEGDISQQVIETLEIDTEGTDVSHVKASAATLGSAVMEESDSLLVDGEEMDVINRVESAFDELTGAGVVEATRTLIDDKTGDAVSGVMQAVIRDDHELTETWSEESADSAGDEVASEQA